MNSKRKLFLRTLFAAFIVCTFASSAFGDFAQSVSDNTKAAILLSVASTYITSEDSKPQKAARLFDAAVVASGIAEILKPNLDITENERFPSGHAAGAFAAATALSEYYPRQKWIWYGLAGLVGWSRVEVGAHEWSEVLGGAALGIAVGKWSINSDKGLIIGRVFHF